MAEIRNRQGKNKICPRQDKTRDLVDIPYRPVSKPCCKRRIDIRKREKMNIPRHREIDDTKQGKRSRLVRQEMDQTQERRTQDKTTQDTARQHKTKTETKQDKTRQDPTTEIGKTRNGLEVRVRVSG
jgi:hypothetical protein